MTTTKPEYTEIPAASVPAAVRFDVPRHLQGQHVEVAFGGFGAAENGIGAPYKRVTERANFPAAVTYYRLVGGARA